MEDSIKMQEVDFSAIDVHDLLPQREPFVAVGRLLATDATTTVTQTVITADNIFVENGRLDSSGLIENIAQTCAVRLGFINKYILKRRIQTGYIGAIRNLTVHDLPRVGETITTTVLLKEEVFGMTLASATVTAADRLLATTEMKIAVKETMNSEL